VLDTALGRPTRRSTTRTWSDQQTSKTMERKAASRNGGSAVVQAAVHHGRHRFPAADDAAGAFWFPSPYQTRGVRLTNGDECGRTRRCVLRSRISYWRRINDYPIATTPETMYISLASRQTVDGTGPTLFSFNKDDRTRAEPRWSCSFCRKTKIPPCARIGTDGGYRRINRRDVVLQRKKAEEAVRLLRRR